MGQAQFLTCDHVDQFVASTRAAIFIREVDQVLMVRPDKTMSLNSSATTLLAGLYHRQAPGCEAVLEKAARDFSVDKAVLFNDLQNLLQALSAILNQDFSPRPGLHHGAFDRKAVQFPTLSEIALTYHCQNRCQFCYASSPDRGEIRPAMTTQQAKTLMDRIFHQGHVPSLSFTGGEATLRKDLPELIRYGKDLGLRINLISNGLRLADRGFAKTLVQAGLDSVQISLEAAEAERHDLIVGKKGAHQATVAGVRVMRELGVHVHTNATLCSENLDHAEALIRFVAQDLKLPTMSMNMVIQTGEAIGNTPIGVTYTQVAARLPALIAEAKTQGLKWVWYSPIPYCIFNPVLHDLGAKSCACVDGILSVDPTGEVLPCSSFDTGIGSLLDNDFATLFDSPQARYWKDKKFAPPVCQGCPDLDLCGGACPLYWDAASSFAELPRPNSDDPELYRVWKQGREASGCLGVQPLPPREVA